MAIPAKFEITQKTKCMGCGQSQDLLLRSVEWMEAHLLGGLLAGSGVLWAWAAMMLFGACRPVPEWPVRLGRLTGVAWIAVGAIGACYVALALD